MHISLWIVCTSENDFGAGSSGRGLSRDNVIVCVNFDLPIHPKHSRVRGGLESSQQGVGNVEVGELCLRTITWRMRDTEIVASVATSLANAGDRGVVVNTTK